MKTLTIYLMTLFYFFKYKQIQKKINVLFSLGDSKKDMVSYIRKLHKSNNGSYQSSNAIILFRVLTFTIKIQHCNGYIIVKTKAPTFSSICYIVDSVTNCDCLNFEDVKYAVENKFFKDDPEPPTTHW